MTIGLVGKKRGMTRLFTEEGHSFPVTVVSVEPNTITQVKTKENDGYSSIQVTTGNKKEKHLSKALSGHFNKASVVPGEGLWEFLATKEEIVDLEVGKSISVNLFEEVKEVDVSGISKGKGFAGTVKRWNFQMQDATHGNSLSHRAPGSIGQCQTPGRVWKGKKMSGQMGKEKVTIQNLKIASIDLENKMILIKGSIPGSTGSRVILRPARGESLDFSFKEETKDKPAPEKETKDKPAPEKETKDKPAPEKETKEKISKKKESKTKEKKSKTITKDSES